MTTVTLDMMRGYLARAVLTQGPDFRYQDDVHVECTYAKQVVGSEMAMKYPPTTTHTSKIRILTEDSAPTKTGCLAGVAIRLAGGDPDKYEGQNASACAFLSLRDVGIHIEDAATTYLMWAQRSQDSGSTWGEAYNMAEENVDWLKAQHNDSVMSW